MLRRNSHISENLERIQFLQEIDIKICIQFWDNSKSILVVEDGKCSECKRLLDEELKIREKYMSRNSFASRLMRSISPSRSEEKTEIKELKDMNHKHYVTRSIDEFMHNFKKLPLYEKLSSIYESEVSEVAEAYKDYLSVLKRLVYDNKRLSTEYNLKILTQHLVAKYLKLSTLRGSQVGRADEQINEKLAKLRLINYSSKLELPEFFKSSEVCKENIKSLETIDQQETPTEKLDTLVTIVNSISIGYVFMANSDEQASADELLYLLCYTILSSSVKNLISEIRYIQIFYLFTEEENYSKATFCLKNFEIALEFLKGIKLENEQQDEDEFELQCDEHDFSSPMVKR